MPTKRTTGGGEKKGSSPPKKAAAVRKAAPKKESPPKVEEPTRTEAVEEPVEPVVTVDPVGELIAEALKLEEPLRAAADEYAAGDNSDAVKSALRNASHGIAHIRKVLDVNARVSR